MADLYTTSINGAVVPEDDSIDLKVESIHNPTLEATHKRKAEAADLPSVESRDDKRRKGTAPIKAEFLLYRGDKVAASQEGTDAADDDAAEAHHHQDRQPASNNSKRREKNQGQNTSRRFGSSKDEVGLCSSRVRTAEFSPEECKFGTRCKFDHNLRKYLSEHKREDLTTFDSLCPVWEVKGTCPMGWKCRFVGSHSTEMAHPDGRTELVLVEDKDRKHNYQSSSAETEVGVANAIDTSDRIALTKKKVPTPKSDAYLRWLDVNSNELKSGDGGRITQPDEKAAENEANVGRNSSSPDLSNGRTATENVADRHTAEQDDNRASFKDPPFRPSEKRRLYFGPETPVLAPLTTQGNLPFRRLCTSLGACFTYSEMAMSVPLLQGHKPEWALVKAHESEVQPPTFTTKSNIVYDYDQSRDLVFGAQIAANKPWSCIKATEVLTTLLPRGLRLVDLNVGCPIDLVYREGAGSALMDSPAKLSKMLRGMNAVSGEVPITCKIRMGTKDNKPTAQKLADRLILGDSSDHAEGRGASGIAAITLHGRSRQQRYTRQADWSYISETAALIQSINGKAASLTDTIRAADDRDLPNPHKGSAAHGAEAAANVLFIGNGDVYSHEHYFDHLSTAPGLSTCMLARGALMKPWLFEEIAAGQYLDKRSSQRLEYVEKFCRFGLEAWGSDEIGVGQTRRFLLEWLSFACRYVPVGLLDVLPPSVQDRPPRYRGRDEMETLMASENFRDWIKISEMFLGPAHRDFRFEPKHKSNSYEIQAEG